MSKLQLILPKWNAPSNINAYSTTRIGGISVGAYSSLNLSMKSGDNPIYVERNRLILKDGIVLPKDPCWLDQIHSTIVCEAKDSYLKPKEADASITNEKNQVCVVLTADCIPILICNSHGTMVGSIHAGWKGLLNGIIEETLDKMNQSSENLMAWIGPSIRQPSYTVGPEVYKSFTDKNNVFQAYFIPSELQNNHWQMDLTGIAKYILQTHGIKNITIDPSCTYKDSNRFFSYRRDGGTTGRMATLIWLT